jgi:hypothetical protein
MMVRTALRKAQRRLKIGGGKALSRLRIELGSRGGRGGVPYNPSVLLLTPRQQTWLRRSQRDWRKVLEPLKGYAPAPTFPPAPVLQAEHVRNCRVFPSREALIQDLLSGGRIAEVGSQEGKFAEFLLQVVHPSELHVFELDAELIRARGVLLRDRRVVLHEGDSSSNLSAMPDRYFDWIYVDADHTYEGVFRDVEQAQVKIKRDGFLVFNDYTMWSYLEIEPYGVVQNVNNLCREAGFEMTHFAFHPWGYHDVAIARRRTSDD